MATGNQKADQKVCKKQESTQRSQQNKKAVIKVIMKMDNQHLW